MSLNTAHAGENGGVLLHAGESILLFCDNVTLAVSGGVPKCEAQGRLFLTTHRIIFNSAKNSGSMRSFSMPFVAVKDVQLEQPVFGANHIKGKVVAQPNGNFTGEASFKLYFKSGGAIDFGMALLKAAQIASRNQGNNAAPPPPYSAPSGPWYAAPPPAYSPNPEGYMGWMPPTNVFSERPPADSVYMTDAPPPYPGINGTYGYAMPSGGAFGGASAPTLSNGEAQAVRTGYYDPNRPHTGYVAQGANDLPPSYDESSKKTN